METNFFLSVLNNDSIRVVGDAVGASSKASASEGAFVTMPVVVFPLDLDRPKTRPTARPIKIRHRHCCWGHPTQPLRLVSELVLFLLLSFGEEDDDVGIA